MATVQRFDMSPDRASAWTVSSLMTKDLPTELQERVKETFVAALTHPVEEVSWYATWGASELWSDKRELALSIHIYHCDARPLNDHIGIGEGR